MHCQEIATRQHKAAAKGRRHQVAHLHDGPDKAPVEGRLGRRAHSRATWPSADAVLAVLRMHAHPIQRMPAQKAQRMHCRCCDVCAPIFMSTCQFRKVLLWQDAPCSFKIVELKCACEPAACVQSALSQHTVPEFLAFFMQIKQVLCRIVKKQWCDRDNRQAVASGCSTLGVQQGTHRLGRA